MYEIKVTSNFSSAHRLRGYKGKCENVHGHNWKVEVSLRGTKLNKLGMVMDFSDLKKKLQVITDELDHKDLNRIHYFQKVNPTSENIARYIHKRMNTKGRLSVTIWESDTASARYEK